MNRGRHKKVSNNKQIENLLETIKKNHHSYRARIKLFKNGKLCADTTSVLTFSEKEDIIRWFNHVKGFFMVDTMTIDTILFKL